MELVLSFDLGEMGRHCGEGAHAVLHGHQLRLQPSETGTARVERHVELQPSTQYRVSARFTSEAGNCWGYIGVNNFDGRGGQLEEGSNAPGPSLVSVDFCTGPGSTTVVIYAHAWKQHCVVWCTN